MKMEKYTASDNMKLFFNKLKDLKEFIENKAEETKDETIIEIYNRLDQLFKIEGK